MTQPRQITIKDISNNDRCLQLATNGKATLFLKVNALTKSVSYAVAVREPGNPKDMDFADLQEAIAHYNNSVANS